MKALKISPDSWPVVIVVALCALLIFSDAWLMHDGIIFHLSVFLTGKINNSGDFSRIAATLLGDGLSLIYYHLGGESFRVSRWLFSIGHAQHVLYPVLFLVYLRRKETDHSEEINSLLYAYVLSLMFYRSMCFFFLVTELNAGHTMAWLMIISYFRERKVMFALSGLVGAFCYPLTVITAGLIFLSSLIRKDKALLIRILCLLVIILGFAGFLNYSRIYTPSGRLMKGFSRIIVGYNVWFTTGATLVILCLKKRWQMILAGTVLLLINVFAVPLFAAQGFWGSLYGLVFLIFFQAAFIVLPQFRLRLETMKPAITSLSLLFLLVMISHAVKLSSYFERVKKFMDATPGVISFEVAESQYSSPEDERLLSPSAIRMQTISLRLLDSKAIKNYIEKHPEINTQDLIAFWGEALFLERAHARGISLPLGSSTPEKGSSTLEK